MREGRDGGIISSDLVWLGEDLGVRCEILDWW